MRATLAQECARMFMVGFPGPAPDEALRGLMKAGVFGAILFKRNLGPAKDVAALCRGLKQEARRPFALAIDQEGGRVARLRGGPFAAIPPMRVIGAGGRPRDEELAAQMGRLLALELRALGIDWDFAPILDVDTNPLNPVIGDRAFSRDPHVVARLGVALSQAMEMLGVASCGKHFPGHGDTFQDSHLTLPHLPHSLERLRAVELVPFRAYAQAKLASLMTAHVVFDALDAEWPATLSDRVLEPLVRQELQFEGVVVSDDLEMKAIADRYSVEEAAVRGAVAGVDLFLVCHHPAVQHRAIEALVHGVESGRVPRTRIQQANARLSDLEARFVRPPEDRFHQLGGSEHRALAKDLGAHDMLGHDPTEA